jgi:hypothetical protein
MKKNLIIVLLLIFTAQGFAVYSQRHHDKGLLYLRISNYGIYLRRRILGWRVEQVLF